MFEFVVLNDYDRRKLAVFQILNSQNASCSISYLAKEFKLSFPATQSLIQSFDRDMITLFDKSVWDESGRVNWHTKGYNYNIYLQFLIKCSLPYQFLLSILTRPEQTIEDFLEENYISRSTAIRALQTTKVCLDDLNVKLNFSKMKIFGEESNIQLLFFYVIWLGSTGDDVLTNEELDLPYYNEKELLKDFDFFNFSHVHPKAIRLMLTIMKIRSLQGYELDEFEGNELIYFDANPVLQQYFSQFIKDPYQIIYHINFLKYVFVFSFYYASPVDSRLTILVDFYQNLEKREQQFHRFLIEFNSFYSKKILPENLTEEEELLIRANLFSTLFSHYTNGGKLPKFYGFDGVSSHSETPGYQKLIEILGHYFEQYFQKTSFFIFKDLKKELLEDLSFILYPYFQKKIKDRRVKVAIIPMINQKILQNIVLFLSQLQFVDYELSVTDHSEIDLFITSFSEILPSTTKPCFIVELTDESNYLSELFNWLWDMYLNNLAPEM